MNYYEARNAARATVAKFDKRPPIGWRGPIGRGGGMLSPNWSRHACGKNIMTDECAGAVLLNRGNLVVSVEFGRFLESWLFAMSVYCVGDLAPAADKLNCELSRCLHSPAELFAAMEELDDALDPFDLHQIAQANELGSYKRGGRNGLHPDALALACNPYQRPALVTAEEAEDMLGAVPPYYPKGAKGFCMGEAITHGKTRDHGAGAVLANYYEEGGQWFARYHFATPADLGGELV